MVESLKAQDPLTEVLMDDCLLQFPCARADAVGVSRTAPTQGRFGNKAHPPRGGVAKLRAASDQKFAVGWAADPTTNLGASRGRKVSTEMIRHVEWLYLIALPLVALFKFPNLWDYLTIRRKLPLAERLAERGMSAEDVAVILASITARDEKAKANPSRGGDDDGDSQSKDDLRAA